jgi:hypothetical protein
MIIVRVKAGLGNQLFQYALGRHLAEKNRSSLILDTVWYHKKRSSAEHADDPLRDFGLEQFHITGKVATLQDLSQYHYSLNGRWGKLLWRFKSVFSLHSKFKYVSEKHFEFDPQILGKVGNLYLIGIWQSERYFWEIRSILCSELTVKDPKIVQYTSSFLEKVRQAGDTIVSVHVRRGDYISRNTDERHASLPVTYFTRAIQQFPSNTHFVIFSDDIGWCKQQFNGRLITFAEGHSVIQDFDIMCHCDHHIIANSTFSWWAAWLNSRVNKIVIAPDPNHWFGPALRHINTSDLIPSDWHVLQIE